MRHKIGCTKNSVNVLFTMHCGATYLPSATDINAILYTYKFINCLLFSKPVHPFSRSWILGQSWEVHSSDHLKNYYAKELCDGDYFLRYHKDIFLTQVIQRSFWNSMVAKKLLSLNERKIFRLIRTYRYFLGSDKSKTLFIKTKSALVER